MPLDTTGWPDLPEVGANDPQAEVKKVQYQSILAEASAIRQDARDRAKADAAANLEREKGDFGVEYATYQAVHQAYLDVAKGSIDRARASAEFVQKSAAAISTAYAAVAALSYAVASNQPLPARGFVATAFLALAILLATAYLAFLTRPDDSGPAPTSGNLRLNQQLRRDAFINWAMDAALHRAYLLRASVISLGLAVAFLPVAYLNVPDDLTAQLGYGGAAMVLALVLIPPVSRHLPWGLGDRLPSWLQA
jgi:hypothetical protein